jgi:hypothetical protein
MGKYVLPTQAISKQGSMMKGVVQACRAGWIGVNVINITFQIRFFLASDFSGRQCYEPAKVPSQQKLQRQQQCILRPVLASMVDCRLRLYDSLPNQDLAEAGSASSRPRYSAAARRWSPSAFIGSPDSSGFISIALKALT